MNNYQRKAKFYKKNVSHKPRVRLNTPLKHCKYRCWEDYFQNEENEDIISYINNFTNYLENQDLEYERIIVAGLFYIDVNHIINNSILKEMYPEVKNNIYYDPEVFIKCMGLAMIQLIAQSRDNTIDQTLDNSINNDPTSPKIFSSTNIPYITPRLLNFEPLTQFKDLKSYLFQKFVSIKGTVIRVSNIKPKCFKLAFECIKCKNVQTKMLPEGKLFYPSRCDSDGCNGHTFTPLLDSSKNKTINSQTIKLQEIAGHNDEREVGRVPRSIECLLLRDLVDCCVPGDVVVLSGIVRATQSEDVKGKKDKSMFLLYIETNSVRNLKYASDDTLNLSRGHGLGPTQKSNLVGNHPTDAENDLSEFSSKDLYAIRKIRYQPDIFRLLVSSFCPSIYGHEVVKSALLLSLFGGTSKFACNLKELPIRGDIHILLVGDPGLGKSQMLKAVINLAPAGVYVCGNTTTAAGLTVTMTKDGSTGDYALEAGALVLSDRGCCCIDEFDKMGAQHATLLEAMEQQTVSVAKAGVLCSLPTRTSVIAAANPHGSGHYDKSKTVSENLRMNGALLSRFDLVFILTDRSDQQIDIMLSEHVMSLHDKDKKSFLTQENIANKTQANTPSNILPHILLRKYICYAKKYVGPCKLDDEAKALIQNFYIDLRQRYAHRLETPLTTRQLESLIRLTEARAKIELRDVATISDAQEVIDIIKFSMWGAAYDDVQGTLDFNRSINGSGTSYKSQPHKFIAILADVAQKEGAIFTTNQLKRLIKDYNIKTKEPMEFINTLNYQGYLIFKGDSRYKLSISG